MNSDYVDKAIVIHFDRIYSSSGLYRRENGRTESI